MKDDLNTIISEEIPFNNRTHVYNHLNYLCRTDYFQKWTNELTKNNYYIDFSKSTDFKPFSEDFEERLKIQEELYSVVYRAITPKKGTFKNLRMMRVEFQNNSDNVSIDDICSSISSLLEKILKVRKIKLLTLVTHFDQKDRYHHFHIIFINKNEKTLYSRLVKK